MWRGTVADQIWVVRGLAMVGVVRVGVGEGGGMEWWVGVWSEAGVWRG